LYRGFISRGVWRRLEVVLASIQNGLEEALTSLERGMTYLLGREKRWEEARLYHDTWSVIEKPK
jgi:hypothetical protein